MTVTITELENGFYSIPISASHSDTNGILTVLFTNAGAKQVNLQWRVETRILDNLAFPTVSGRSIDVEATGEVGINLDNTVGTLDAAQIGADAITAAKIAANAIGASELAADAIGASQLATDGVEEIADQVWDEILTGATHAVVDSAGRRLRDLQEFGVYEGGAIWIDTVNGSPGTTDFESGTAFNPVNNIADANTLATSLGLSRFQLAPESSITFVASQEGQVFLGNDWNLALGGQSVSNSHFEGAEVSGTATMAGGKAHFKDCNIGTCTLGVVHLEACGLVTTLTLSDADTYLLIDCYSEIAGAGAPVINFGAAVGNTSLNMRHWSGGIQIEAMGDLGTDTMSLEGNGQLIEGTCTGGTVVIRGMFTVSGITNLTLSDDARIDVDQIGDAAWDELIAGHLGVGSTGEALNNATAPTAAVVADAVWDEDIVAAHGVADSAGLLVRALGAVISQRANNATLNALLGVADVATRDIPEQVWLEGTRDLTALGFQLDTADFVAAFLDVTLIAANAIGASQLATDAGQEIADRFLARSLATGADGGRTVQDALRLLRNLRQIVAGTLTVMEEDDVTPAWTAAITTAAGNPVDSIDPA